MSQRWWRKSNKKRHRERQKLRKEEKGVKATDHKYPKEGKGEAKREKKKTERRKVIGP